MSFYYDQDFDKLNFRETPHLYRIGKGEQGVLSVEPYKSEILPHWRFRTPDIAQESADKIYEMFLDYLDEDDFVGADMARKFLQMGYTRSRRYANHKSGRKYSKEDKENAPKIDDDTIPDYKDPKNKAHYIKTKTKKVLPRDPDPEKAKSAEIFYEKYQLAKENPRYTAMKEQWREDHK
ncbi:MAG: DUF4385 domain-containing protein [Phototrophicaceae bacterium]